MQFVGIDIGSEQHVVAIVDERGGVVLKATKFGEEADGYKKLLEELLGPPDQTLIAMEATGHYWKNLFAALTAGGYAVALLNPIRTARFAAEDLQRTKTDAIDALSIARFACQKRPPATRLSDAVTDEIKELVRHRDRLVQDMGDRVRQLHRLVDLGFPEFKQFVPSLDSAKATSILRKFPTAEAFRRTRVGTLANLKYDARHTVGRQLAQELLDAAKVSVGAHHSPAYRLQVEHFCDDIERLRQRIAYLDHGIGKHLDDHEVGKLLTTIDGIGPTTAARIIAEVGDPAAFRDGNALAAYVGVVPALRHSGKRAPARAGISGVGNARLRTALWMPVLTAVRKNPWLKAYYDGLRARGKLPKVALVAAMRKLLMAIYSVAKNRKPFVPRLSANEVSA